MKEEKIAIMFFCLGNICRSPIAEALFRVKVRSRGIEECFHIQSSGTSGYHAGERPDPGSHRVVLSRIGEDINYQRSQQLIAEDLRSFDYLVAMDASNIANARILGEGNLFLLRDYDPQGAGDIPDPWGDGGAMFDVVYDMVDRSTETLLNMLVKKYHLQK